MTIKLHNESLIPDLDQIEVFKCHINNKRQGIQHAPIKQSSKECFRYERLIHKTELNAQNKFEAINA